MADTTQNYRWVIGASSDKNEEMPDFFHLYHINSILAKILWRRGINSKEKLDHFLHDSLQNLSDPFLMKGMKEAVERIAEAIEKHQKIVIYGDYDVDGITSTSVMMRALQELGANVSFYIPVRKEEGYGLNEKALTLLTNQGYDLLITVDCGISSAQLIDEFKDQLDIIVTDHHIPPAIIPKCTAVLNPHQEDCPYPFKELCGCGVAFVLCRGLYKQLTNHYYDQNVELVALATIADVVSLTGENRIIVREGMKRMPSTSILGLKSLMKVSGLLSSPDSVITHADQLSFTLAPRLNAAGRIAKAAFGVELMLTKSEEEADEMARHLNDINAQRKDIEAQIYQAAQARIAELHIADDSVLVIDGEHWHPGVIGIVASRVLEQYHRPVLVLSVENGVGKGSCRSIPGFNIVKALESQKDLLLQYGGHEMAAGFSLKEENISAFRRGINEYAKTVMTDDMFTPLLPIEDQVPLEDMTTSFVDSLSLLEPCGTDNPKPIFEIPHAFVETSRRMGNDKQHFKCEISSKNTTLEAVKWNCHAKDPVLPGEIADLVVDPQIHEWHGRHVQLLIRDIRVCQAHLLTREFLVEVYKKLVYILKEQALPIGEVYKKLGESGLKTEDPIQISLAIGVFLELSILRRYFSNGFSYIQLQHVGHKDLTTSSIYVKYKK